MLVPKLLKICQISARNLSENCQLHAFSLSQILEVRSLSVLQFTIYQCDLHRAHRVARVGVGWLEGVGGHGVREQRVVRELQ